MKRKRNEEARRKSGPVKGENPARKELRIIVFAARYYECRLNEYTY